MQPASENDATVVSGADGSLVTEYSTTVDLVKRSIDQDSHDPYTCSVDSAFVHACLDIAASSTTDTNLFGQQELCHGVVVGDGRLNSFDTHTLIMAYFQDGPYEDVRLTTETVQPRSDVAARCLDGANLATYNASYEDDKCFQRRRLQSEADLNAMVMREVSNEDGSWYRVAIPGRWTAVELFLDMSLTAPLSNKAAVDLEDDRPPQPEVRFARHASNVPCAPIISTIDSMTAMYRSVLAVGQSPTTDKYTCGFDLFVWVPRTQGRNLAEEDGCDLHVLPGSSAMGEPSGAQQYTTSDCTSPSDSNVLLRVTLSVSNSTVSYESMRHSIASVLAIDVAHVSATTGRDTTHVIVTIAARDIATAHRYMTTLSQMVEDVSSAMTHFGVAAVSILAHEIVDVAPPPPPSSVSPPPAEGPRVLYVSLAFVGAVLVVGVVGVVGWMVYNRTRRAVTHPASQDGSATKTPVVPKSKDSIPQGPRAVVPPRGKGPNQRTGGRV